MKKYLLYSGLLALLFPMVSQASNAQLFWFMDNQGYDISGQVQGFKLMDGNCYDMQGSHIDCVSGLAITTDPTPVTITPAASSPIVVSPAVTQPATQAAPTPVQPADPALLPPYSASELQQKLAGCQILVSFPQDNWITSSQSGNYGQVTGMGMVNFIYANSASKCGKVNFQGQDIMDSSLSGNALALAGEYLGNGVGITGNFLPNTNYSYDFIWQEAGRQDSTLTVPFVFEPGIGVHAVWGN